MRCCVARRLSCCPRCWPRKSEQRPGFDAHHEPGRSPAYTKPIQNIANPRANLTSEKVAHPFAALGENLRFGRIVMRKLFQQSNGADGKTLSKTNLLLAPHNNLGTAATHIEEQ